MSIFSVVNDILSVGVGSADGIRGIFKTTAGDVANSLAKNKALSKFSSLGFTYTGADELTVDLANGVQKKFNKGDVLTASSFNDMQKILNAVGNDIDSNKLVKAGGKITQADAEEANKTIKQMIDAFNDVRGKAEKGTYITLGSDALNKDASLRTLLGRTEKQKGLGTYNMIASGYFGDEKLGSARVKGALGIGAGGVVGMRFLQGGDLTHNVRGENDIAGIPFF